jgi:MICOS complex subunit MIC12
VLSWNSELTYKQLGGFTLTTTLLYLSISLHTRNRVHQAALLHQQSLILTNIVEPIPPLPSPTTREVRVGLLETAKDKWNAELESNVRKLQQVDWSAVRERMEEGVSSVYRRAFEKGREVAPDPPK